MRSGEGIVAGLIGASLICFGVSNWLGDEQLVQVAILLMGCGIGAAAWFDLRRLITAVQLDPQADSRLRQLWGLGRAGFLLALGWGIAFAGATALLLGWDGVLKGILARPGPLLVALGLALIGGATGRLLALDEPPARGWEAILRLPLRLAGLPAILIGIGLTAVGAFQTLAPQGFHAWVQSILAGRALGN